MGSAWVYAARILHVEKTLSGRHIGIIHLYWNSSKLDRQMRRRPSPLDDFSISSLFPKPQFQEAEASVQARVLEGSTSCPMGRLIRLATSG